VRVEDPLALLGVQRFEAAQPANAAAASEDEGRPAPADEGCMGE
jgi:hypothetical protein